MTHVCFFLPYRFRLNSIELIDRFISRYFTLVLFDPDYVRLRCAPGVVLREDAQCNEESSNLRGRVYSGIAEFRRSHLLLLLPFSVSSFSVFILSCFRSCESPRSKHTRIRKDSRHYRAVKELVLFAPSSFSLSSSVSSFVTRRSVRARVSRLRSSSTSHYVRAKEISREFHTLSSFRVVLRHHHRRRLLLLPSFPSTCRESRVLCDHCLH